MFQIVAWTAFFVCLAAGLSLVRVFGRHVVQLVYYSSKIPGPSIWEGLSVHLKYLFSKSLLTYSWKMCASYGYKPWGVWVYHYFVIVVSDSNTLSEVFRNKDMTKKSWFLYKGFPSFIGDGLLTNFGQKYKLHRMMIKPCFQRTHLETRVLQLTNESVSKMVDKLRKKATGESVDVRRILQDLSVELSFSVLTSKGITYSDLTYRKYSRTINFAESLIQLQMINPVYHWLSRQLMPSKRQSESELTAILATWKNAFIDLKKHIKSQMKDDNWRPSSAFEMMVKAGEETDFSDDDLCAEANTFIVAASETTSFIAYMSLILLAIHPDIEERVFQEVKSIFQHSDRAVEPEDLDKMVYLERVLKETLRLFPPAPMIGRHVDAEAKLGDLVVPKGSSVLINLFALHRNPDNFADPLKFDPDRFLPSEKRRPTSYIPFSYMSRSCPGQMQAFLLLKTLVSSVVRNFYILPGDSLKSMDDLQVKMAITMRLIKPLPLRFVHRKSSHLT